MSRQIDPVREPMIALGSVLCQQEQALAALRILSDNLQDAWDGSLGIGKLPESQERWLTNQWLLLEVIQRDCEATYKLLGEVEKGLCAKGATQLP